jgi:hypothetical protein
MITTLATSQNWKAKKKRRKKHWWEGEKEVVHQFQRREFGNGGWKNK